jgi:uncharacterized protein YjbI with pentapeptide repeats
VRQPARCTRQRPAAWLQRGVTDVTGVTALSSALAHPLHKGASLKAASLKGSSLKGAMLNGAQMNGALKKGIFMNR